MAFNVHNATIPAQDVQRVHVRNNIFYATGGLKVLSVSADQINGAVDLRFEGNVYYAAGATPSIRWGNTTYAGLNAWRTATTQELLGGVPVGGQVNPSWANPGGGGTIGNADLLNTLTAYRLAAGSAVIDRGLNLSQRFGLNAGSADFFGGSIAYGADYDIGAHEWR